MKNIFKKPSAGFSRRSDIRSQLQAVAKETKATLPKILPEIQGLNTSKSSVQNIEELPKLDPQTCPGYILPEGDPEAGQKGTRIRVYDIDTFDTALELQPGTTVTTILPSPRSTSTPPNPDEVSPLPKKPVLVLNLASEKTPGGGWENGSLAQEEALCFRSSLSLSLHRSHYPLPPLSTIYTPDVVLIRTSMSHGHTLLWPQTPAADLPVTSILSVAALRSPKLTRQMQYANPSDLETTKRKIRAVLRAAAFHGHTKLVLGALGCGVFGNPPRQVAQCFLDVLREDEFMGGRWEDVVFAILDNVRGENGGKDGVGNYGVFYRALDGVVV